MNKCVNGFIIPMTAEEISEMERISAEMPELTPTPEQRLSELEEAFTLLLEGRTE